jgi:hypothetical protein
VAFAEHFDPGQGSSSVLSDYVFGEPSPPGGPDDLAKIQAADPATKVTPASAPTFVANSSNELVPVALAEAYVGILEQNGVPHDFLEVPGRRHGTRIAFAARLPTLDFFDEHVRDATLPSSSPSPTAVPPTSPPATLPPTQRPAGSGNWLPLAIVGMVAVALLAVMVVPPAIRKRRRDRRPT